MSDGDEPTQQRIYWEAAILGVACVALVLGTVGIVAAACHAYRKHRRLKSQQLRELSKFRPNQLYDSITIVPNKEKTKPKVTKMSYDLTTSTLMTNPK